MDILSLLVNQLSNQETLSHLGKAVNAEPTQVKKLAQVGLPTLLEALTRNASTEEGAASLNNALEQHQDENVDDVLGFLKGADTQDGAKILEHILGNKSSSVQTKLASNTGLDVSQVSSLLTQFAPLVLAYLGNQKKQSNVSLNGQSGVASGLGALLDGSGSSNLMGIASKFLDTDGDGDVMDDLSKMLGGFLK